MEYERQVPDKTLETVARSFHKEGLRYGFSKLDFVHFVNLLLDVAIEREGVGTPAAAVTPLSGQSGAGPHPVTDLPWVEGRILLRPIELPADLPLFRRWGDDTEGRNFALTCSSARFECIESLIQSPESHFAVVCLTDRSPIGAMGFIHHDPIQGKAEMRKIVGEIGARGRGYAKEAGRLWIRYGFEVLGLRKIYLDTLKTHLRNIKLNEDLGFSVEGILRSEILVDGVERDVLRMGLCRPVAETSASQGQHRHPAAEDSQQMSDLQRENRVPRGLAAGPSARTVAGVRK